MYGSRFSRSSRRGGSPSRRPASPELPPFPGDCEDYLRYRYPSPTFDDYRRRADYGARFDDYPFPPRDYSPQRFADLSRSGDYRRPGDNRRSGDHRRSGDYYRRDYEQRFREGSPRPDGDYEDYFCRDNTEFGRFSERRPRAPSTGRDRSRRPVAAGSRSPKRVAALSPSQYEERTRRPYRAGRRSLSPVPYFGYSTVERTPQQGELNTRGRSGSPSVPQPDAMYRRQPRRLGGNYAGYANEMASRYRRDNDRRRDSSPEEQVSQLPHVEKVEFYAPQNAREHHTLKYELVRDRYRPDPVLRRGQPFYLAVRLNRQLEPAREKLYVVFQYGPRAAVTLGTKVYLMVNKREFTKEKQHWDCRIHGVDGNNLVLQIQIPFDCLVGDWSASIQTVAGGSMGRRRAEFKCRENVYILFNPWCEEDPCYMENDDDREEYVNNDNGKIYVGAHNSYKGRHWVFGQHDNTVLPAVQLILEMSGLSHAERGSPVKVVRALTGALHTENRDGGVLEARWGGEYEGGVSPWTWTGSVRILEQFLRSGGAPVKYGQCWVFSGLLTTVCRSLGIPCRSLTNFVSAHDTDGTLTVDKFFDIFREELDHGPNGDANDSLWNFHVWNDAWMARPDLPQGYGGWQAIDATPQQESDNKYQCGPCSLEAIRRGEVGFGYDTTFLFSEVNADLVHWVEDEQSEWGFSKMKNDKYHVGRSVLTKRCGASHDDDDDDAEDITHLYKNPEGTAAERLAVFNAVRGTAGAQKYFDYPESDQEDVVFELADIEQVMIGQPFHVDVSVVNKSSETRTIKAFLHANSMYYTGIKALDIVREPVEFTLQGGQTEKLVVEITPEKYMDKLVDYCMVKIYAMASVTETRQSWSEEDDFVISKPKLRVQPEEPCVVGKQCRITFSFVNPLDMTLTGCMFSFEGSGLTRPKVVKLRSTVPPHETFSHTETFVAREAGDKTIVASFQCRQLFDIEGSKTFTVSA